MKREPINIRIHPDTNRELNDCAERLRTSRTAIIERALLDFFQRECLTDRTTEARTAYSAAER